MEDNVGARLMNSSGEYEKIKDDGEKISSQSYFVKEAEEKNRIAKQKNEKNNNFEEKNSKPKKNFWQKLVDIFKR